MISNLNQNRSFAVPSEAVIDAEIRMNKNKLDKNVEEMLNSAIPEIIKVLRSKGKLNGSMNAEDPNKIRKALFNQLTADLAAPGSVFGPFAALSGKHSADEISKAIENVVSSLE